MAHAEDGFTLEDIRDIGNVFVLEVGSIIDSMIGSDIATSQITAEALKILEHPNLDDIILDNLEKGADETW